MAHLPCVHTIELNKYLDEQDRDIAEAEYRDSKRQDLETEYKQKLDVVYRSDADIFESMCSEFGVEFKDWLYAHYNGDGVYEYFCKRFNNYADKALSQLVSDFDFESEIDEVIENEKELYDE
jgi:hypothetical protein